MAWSSRLVGKVRVAAEVPLKQDLLTNHDCCSVDCQMSAAMMLTGPQLIKAVKSSEGGDQQPAKKSQWQTLARQLEIRLAMWQRHAAAAEAVAQRVGHALCA